MSVAQVNQQSLYRKKNAAPAETGAATTQQMGLWLRPPGQAKAFKGPEEPGLER